jgi:hypothetical protein
MQPETREDEFLWWMRRCFLAGTAALIAYAATERPMLFFAVPIALFGSLISFGGILKDRARAKRTMQPGEKI